MEQYIDLCDITDNDKVANLDLSVCIKPWEYGNNRSIDINGKIAYLVDSYGYKNYASSYGFDIGEVIESFTYELENLDEDDIMELTTVLDTIVMNL